MVNEKKQKMCLEDARIMRDIGLVEQFISTKSIEKLCENCGHLDCNTKPIAHLTEICGSWIPSKELSNLSEKFKELQRKSKFEYENAQFKSIPTILSELDAKYLDDIEKYPTSLELGLFNKFIQDRGILGAEYWFCPEENYYAEILNYVKPADVVFDIGAGDLRLDFMLSQKVKKVYAIEINPECIAKSLTIAGLSLPKNLSVIVGNGFEMPIPCDVTLIIMLMIHCQHEFTTEMKQHKIIFARPTGLKEFNPNEKEIKNNVD